MRCFHLIDKEMLGTKEIERIFRFQLNGMRSSHVGA